jgi:hypothetical protein
LPESILNAGDSVTQYNDKEKKSQRTATLIYINLVLISV